MTRQLFRRIADDLRERISSGELRTGSQLPTHEDLMKQYSTTRITVRRALEELTRERLIVGRQPHGMFVRDQHRYRLVAGPSRTGFTPPFPSFGDQYLAALDGPLSQTVDVQRVGPPTGVGERLKSNRPVLLRHRLMYSGKTAVSIANGFFPTAVADGTELAQPQILQRDVYEVLDDLGVRIVRLTDEVFVRMADPNETAEIGWPTGSPVFGQLQTGYTAADEPVACFVTLLPGDTWVLAAERRREPISKIRAVG